MTAHCSLSPPDPNKYMVALPNAINPSFDGNVKARSFSTIGTASMVKAVFTQGTTEVNVFGVTNGFDGTVTAVTTISKGATAADITLRRGFPSATSGTIAKIIKSATLGAMVGSALDAGVSFNQDGTLTVASDSTDVDGQALVIVTFEPRNTNN